MEKVKLVTYFMTEIQVCLDRSYGEWENHQEYLSRFVFYQILSGTSVSKWCVRIRMAVRKSL